MEAHLDAMESRLPLGGVPPPPDDIEAIFAELGVGKAAPRRQKREKKANAAAAL